MQKRFTNDKCTITCGSVIGHRHVEDKTNRQDSYSVYCDNEVTSGVIVDGCSSCSHAEVSSLISKFVARYAFLLSKMDMKLGTQLSVNSFVKRIFNATVRYIDTLTDTTLPFSSPEEKAQFINDYLMGVIVGFRIDHTIPEQPTVIYFAGDPIISWDDEDLLEVNQNNKPTYLMYNCIDSAFLESPDLAIPFFSDFTFNLSNHSRFMISSDGFSTFNYSKMRNWCRLSDEDTFEEMSNINNSIHGQQWNKKGAAGLQMWLNRCSKRGYFEDDTTLITVERIADDQESNC